MFEALLVLCHVNKIDNSLDDVSVNQALHSNLSELIKGVAKNGIITSTVMGLIERAKKNYLIGHTSRPF